MAMLSKKSRTSGEIPTSSMADIAFLLLIFFLVTTIFDEQRGLPIVLPEPADEVEVSQQNILHLVVRATGLIEVQRGESPNIQTVTADQIRTLWRTEFAQNDLLIAAVKTEPNAPYVHMINVLDELHVAGAERISLQILE
jgi:biopolymer transport protein ExbD